MKNKEEISFEIGNEEVLLGMEQERAMPPFAESAVAFLERLSQRIKSDPWSRTMQDVAAFGFWCREKGIRQKKVSYDNEIPFRLGRGISLQFVSSNVPVLFAFSLAAAILSGNCIMMRLPSKKNTHMEYLLQCLREIITDDPEWHKRIVILRYSHNKEITDRLSMMCDSRIIWGGDATINEIRCSPLPVRAIELTFADRTSAAVLQAAQVLEQESLLELVYGFYCDTYLNDQNACSSPSVIYWIGETDTIELARKKFWDAVYAYAKTKYEVEASVAIKKWEQAAFLGAVFQEVCVSNQDNLIIRANVLNLEEAQWDYLTPGGFFIESSGRDMEGILPMLTKRCQTITCFGIAPEEVAGFLIEQRVEGVDRVVSCGQALDFTLTWDGYDLITYLSRKISIS